MVEPRDAMTAQAVAEALGVSSARVRQLVDEGRLPPPLELGPRAHVWHCVDVEAVRDNLAGVAVTRPSALLAAAPAPLRRTFDAVVEYPSSWGPLWQAHVRIWRGEAAEGLRTIVVLGAVFNGEGGSGVMNSVEDLAAFVDDRLLRGSGPDAVWFDYWPNEAMDPHRVHNVILRVDGSGGAVRAGKGGAAQRRFCDPMWRDYGVSEIERVVGAAVECFPERTYTRSTIEQWQRTRQIIEVPDDRSGLTELLRALEVLELVPADHPNRDDANKSCRLLATDIRARLSAVAAAPWDDGTKPPVTPPAKDAGWPRLFAAKLVRPEPRDIDFDRLRRYSSEFNLPINQDENERVRPLLERLRMWFRDTDEFADHCDPEVHAALAQAEEVLTTYMHSADPAFETKDCPLPTCRLFQVAGELDRRYLKAVHWDDDGVPVDARRRRLRSQLALDSRRAIRFGVDPWYRVVAHDPKDKVFAVEWPYGPPEEGVPDSSSLVADGATGDRPVYIELPDGRLDLLPAHPAPFLDAWNFGYDGGGPFTLVTAIERTFELVDGVEAERLPRAWIRDQVNHADQGRLRIGVGELRRRMGTGEGW